MSFLSFPTERAGDLVADASVAINLNATGDASRIIRALSNRLVVTRIAYNELREGLLAGHDDARLLETLIDDGLIEVAELSESSDDLFRSLIGSGRTLHDGEAATICCALERMGIVLVDERKGRSVCAERFPELPIASTSDLLLAPEVASALGSEAHVQAVLGALQGARMRVPNERLDDVVKLIGIENATLCPSLPRRLRS